MTTEEEHHDADDLLTLGSSMDSPSSSSTNKKKTSLMSPGTPRPNIVSQLTIHRADAKRHGGRYECSPDNIKPASINLHVIKGEWEMFKCLSDYIESRLKTSVFFRFGCASLH